LDGLLQFIRESSEVACDKRNAKHSGELGDRNRAFCSKPIRIIFIIGVGPLIAEHFDLNNFAITANLNNVRQEFHAKTASLGQNSHPNFRTV